MGWEGCGYARGKGVLELGGRGGVAAGQKRGPDVRNRITPEKNRKYACPHAAESPAHTSSACPPSCEYWASFSLWRHCKRPNLRRAGTVRERAGGSGRRKGLGSPPPGCASWPRSSPQSSQPQCTALPAATQAGPGARLGAPPSSLEENGWYERRGHDPWELGGTLQGQEVFIAPAINRWLPRAPARPRCCNCLLLAGSSSDLSTCQRDSSEWGPTRDGGIITPPFSPPAHENRSSSSTRLLGL